ncbi:MAG: hypothetical protein ACK559_05770, partial [bacterium]
MIATFIPPQLGNFKTTLKMIIQGGLAKVPVRLLGECSATGDRKILLGGDDKLPDDFIIKHKFVDSEEEKMGRIEKKKALELKEMEYSALLTKSRGVPSVGVDDLKLEASEDSSR